MIRTLRIIRWTALGLTLLLAIGVAVLELRPPGEPSGRTGAGAASVPAGVSIGGPFHLTDDKGHAVTDATYRGRWMLVFFGYTHCPDECPLTLQKMAVALRKLGPLAGKVTPLFITVDPTRDTPARLASYLGRIDPRIIGLTGRSMQIAAVAKAYGVYYSREEHETSGAAIVGHSTFLYLMDPSGRFAALFPQDATASALARVLREKLALRP